MNIAIANKIIDILKCAYPAEAYKMDQAGMTDASGNVRTVGAGFMVLLAQSFDDAEEQLAIEAVKRLCLEKTSVPSIADIRREAEKLRDEEKTQRRVRQTQRLLVQYDRRSEEDIPTFFTDLIERMKKTKESAK